MMRLAHGYTNTSLLDGTIVTKRYQGTDAGERLIREAAALRALASYLPVPEILEVDVTRQQLHTTYIPSRHGQDVVDAGHASPVLALCGKLLRHLQALSPLLLGNVSKGGTVIVHGDFGPQNVLLAPRAWAITALVDWEWVHLGDPIEDVAWAEWIVRTHHPHAVPALPALFDGYGERAAWKVRQDAMLRQCGMLLTYAAQQQQLDVVTLWQTRLQATEQFTEGG
jgi:aminoglycoside phosphotransferase